jgi:hypothetical protein
MFPQRPHRQSGLLAAHGSKTRVGQPYKDPVNCSGGYLDPLNLADPEPLGTKRRTRSSSKEFILSKQLVFTPAQVYPIAPSRSTTSFLARKSVSSPVFLDPHATSPPPYSKYFLPESLPGPPFHHMDSDTDDDRDEDGMIYTSPISSQTRHSSQGLRSRIFGLASRNPSRVRDKPISTTPGVLCAGETETETDEPVSVVYCFICAKTISSLSY